LEAASKRGWNHDPAHGSFGVANPNPPLAEVAKDHSRENGESMQRIASNAPEFDAKQAFDSLDYHLSWSIRH